MDIINRFRWASGLPAKFDKPTKTEQKTIVETIVEPPILEEKKACEPCKKILKKKSKVKKHVKESMGNYDDKSNAQSWDDGDKPVNLGNITNSINGLPKESYFVKALEKKTFDDEPVKVKVPESVKKDLRDAMKQAEQDANALHMDDRASIGFHQDTSKYFKQLLDLLDSGTIEDIKKAQHHMTTVHGLIQYRLPDSVVKFLAYAGQPRTLKNIYKEIKGE